MCAVVLAQRATVTQSARATESMTEQQQPRDPGKLSATLAVWLYVYLAAQVCFSLSSGYQILLLSEYDPSTPASYWETLPGTEIFVLTAGVLGLFLVESWLVAGFLTLKWIYRVNKNAHVLATGLRSSPGWSVGWYFIPFALLWKPFKGLEEAWKVSADPARWESVQTPTLLRWWWGLWLVNNIVSNASARLSLQADTIGLVLLSNYCDLASGMLTVPLVLVLVAVVRRLTLNQSRELQQRVF